MKNKKDISIYIKLICICLLVAGGIQPAPAQQLSLNTSPAQDEYSRAIETARAWIDSLMEAQNIPGVQIGVWVKGKTAWLQGFGYADVEQRVPVWPYTKMRIGSVSKTLTSAAVGKLVEAGKLDLDKPVQHYVSYFPEKEYTITTRQVAGHIAGIRHYRGNEFLSDKFYPTVKAGIQIFADDSLLFKPGTKFHYSSYGWNLVSAVVEGASGEPFLEYMNEEVFEPLNMTHTVPEYMNQIIFHRTEYYVLNENGLLENAPYVDNSYKWAGGGFIGTAGDLLKFGAAMLGDDFLQAETISMLWKSRRTNDGKLTHYGIGWASGTDRAGRRWVGHSGGSVGGTTQFVIFPQQRVIIAIVSNLSDVDYNGLHVEIAHLFMKKQD